jgi:uncharacterized protein
MTAPTENPSDPGDENSVPFIKKLKKKLIRQMYIILIATVSAYLLVCLLLVCFQNRFVFVPRSNLFITPKECKLEYEDLSLKSSDGNTINAWYVPAKDAEYTVLFCHGNAGNLSNRIETVDHYHRLGFNFLIFDYPGYGKSTGGPTDKNILESAEAAWKYLTENRKIPENKIIVIGRSLGGVPASHLAAKYKPAMLCSEAAFISSKEVAKDIMPILPTSILVRINLPTGKNIAKANCPVLIIHSPHDEIIKYRHGKALFKLAPEPKELHSLGGGHNDCWFVDQKNYGNIFKKFLDKHCKNK